MLFMVLVIGSAGSFGGDQAGADGAVGPANRTEEPALQRGFYTPQNLAAGAPGWILSRRDLKIKNVFRGKSPELGPQSQAALGDHPQTPPDGIAGPEAPGAT